MMLQEVVPGANIWLDERIRPGTWCTTRHLVQTNDGECTVLRLDTQLPRVKRLRDAT